MPSHGGALQPRFSDVVVTSKKRTMTRWKEGVKGVRNCVLCLGFQAETLTSFYYWFKIIIE